MIDYLRKNRLGRATFLPLSSVRGRTLSAQERQVLRMPGCVGVASRAGAATTRNIAAWWKTCWGAPWWPRIWTAGIAIMRAGRHAFRLVTLEGDVMHSGGSMTGGIVSTHAPPAILSRQREIDEHRAGGKEPRAKSWMR